MRYSFVLRAAAMLVIGTVPLLADFSYDQTSQITGGAMLKVIHVAAAFSKKTRQMTEPMLSTISIKGNRMVRKSADQATIIDLDQQTITTVHFTDKTYSVVTFEQLKQQMAAAAEKMKSRDKQQPQQGDMSFDVKVSDTGQTKVINGNNTHEMVMTMTASSTDPKSGGQGALNMVNHVWIAPDVPGYGEVRDFHRRMAETLGWVPGENPLISRPDMAQAMGQVYKEASKLDGMPLLTIVKMGATAQGTPDSSAQTQPQDQSSQQQQSAAAPPPTSVGDALSGALAGRFGLGRHKKHADSAPANQDPPAEKVSSQQSDQPQQSEASLMEMTSQVTNYNSAAVDPAVFTVPSGFEKVEQDLTNPRKRR